MSRYIDSERLIAEIERQKYEVFPTNDGKVRVYSTPDQIQSGWLNALKWVRETITSLQQEQPKFKVGDTIHKIGENTVLPMTIERIYDGDYVCVTEHQQSFINIKFQDDYELVEQEKPEVNLEEEITRFFSENPIPYEHITDWPLLKNTAIHFYELGLNARKEE